MRNIALGVNEMDRREAPQRNFFILMTPLIFLRVYNGVQNGTKILFVWTLAMHRVVGQSHSMGPKLEDEDYFSFLSGRQIANKHAVAFFFLSDRQIATKHVECVKGHIYIYFFFPSAETACSRTILQRSLGFTFDKCSFIYGMKVLFLFNPMKCSILCPLNFYLLVN